MYEIHNGFHAVNLSKSLLGHPNIGYKVFVHIDCLKIIWRKRKGDLLIASYCHYNNHGTVECATGHLHCENVV